MSDRSHENFLNETFLGNSDDITLFPSKRDDSLLKCLVDVNRALSDKGYDPINQIVGYLMSGDPVYITSYKDARKSISSFSREEILKYLLKKCLN